MMFVFGKKAKFLSLLVGLSFLFSGISGVFLFSSPKEAEAQAFVPVYDAANWATNTAILGINTAILGIDSWHANQYWWKEYILDPIVWALVSNILASVVDDIMSWVAEADIFNFFDEGAAFVQDPLRFFNNVAEAIAGEYISDIMGAIGAGCTEFPEYTLTAIEDSLQSSFNLNATHDFRAPNLDLFGCDIGGLILDYEEFVYGNNFYQGGWEGFFSLTQNPSHNPVGTYLMAQAEIAAQQQMELEQLERELEMGDGFFSPRDGGQIFGSFASSIITPGSTIADLASHVAGTDLRRMEEADEFSEIIAILLGLVMGHIFGGEGLASAFNTGQIDDERWQTEPLDPGHGVADPDPGPGPGPEPTFELSCGNFYIAQDYQLRLEYHYNVENYDEDVYILLGRENYPGLDWYGFTGSGSGSNSVGLDTFSGPLTIEMVDSTPYSGDYSNKYYHDGNVLASVTCPSFYSVFESEEPAYELICGDYYFDEEIERISLGVYFTIINHWGDRHLLLSDPVGRFLSSGGSGRTPISYLVIPDVSQLHEPQTVVIAEDYYLSDGYYYPDGEIFASVTCLPYTTDPDILVGSCGPAQDVPSASPPDSGLCAVGEPYNQEVIFNWLWSCVADDPTNPYTTANCWAPRIYD